MLVSREQDARVIVVKGYANLLDIGGALANPATQYPGAFGHIQFFIDYPYALSTFVAGALCMSGTLCTLILLKEVSLLFYLHPSASLILICNRLSFARTNPPLKEMRQNHQ